jgi:hypothetical protein
MHSGIDRRPDVDKLRVEASVWVHREPHAHHRDDDDDDPLRRAPVDLYAVN